MKPNIIHNRAKNERYIILMNELATQGIVDYEIWDAVHDVTVIKSINLAHKQIVKWAKENNQPSVLIFEDDIKFTDTTAFEYYLRNIPEDYDIYLGGYFLGEVKDVLLHEFTALHCYMVHERFYDIFLGTKDDIHLDQALAGLGKYVPCQPIVAIQHNGWSDNARQYCNFDRIFQSKILYKNQNLQECLQENQHQNLP